MPRYRIVFMGSPDFAIPALDQLRMQHDVCAVYAQPAKPSGRGLKPTPMPLATYAELNDIPLFTPSSLTFHEEQQKLGAHKADFFVVVAYGLLLPKLVLNLPRLGCINGHASLLPRWRGAAPIQCAIAAGDKDTGISAMLMDEGLDTGLVLAQLKCVITSNETAGSLHDKLANLNATLLSDVIRNFPVRLKLAKPQDHNNANYAAKITSQDAKIDWTRAATDLDRRIRAHTPFPGAWCPGPKGRLRILAAHSHSVIAKTREQPGTVMTAQADTLEIATGYGALVIDWLQPAGKKPMKVRDFLNGQRLTIGQPLTADCE